MCDLSFMGKKEAVPYKRLKLQRESTSDSTNTYLHNFVANSAFDCNIAVKFIDRNVRKLPCTYNPETTSTGCNLHTNKSSNDSFAVEKCSLVEHEDHNENNIQNSIPGDARRIDDCEDCRSYVDLENRKDDGSCILNDEFLHEKAVQNRLFLDSLQYKFISEGSTIVKKFLQQHFIACGFIGIGFSPGVFVPSVLLGVMESGCGFYPMDYKKPISDNSRARSILQMDWIIVDPEYLRFRILEDKSRLVSISLIHQININFSGKSLDCFLVKLQKISTIKRTTEFPPYKYAYAMKTSGTTGNGKVVLVPHQAICLNVLDFINLFKVSSKDTILSIAPITFDPSIIDLFITLKCGAKLIQMSEDVKLIPAEVVKVILEEKVTILQCTPSFLLRFDKLLLKTTIFNAQTSQLRILAFGGEKCLNKSYLQSVIPPEKQKLLEIFNLYGVTEVSCWSTVSPINLSTVETSKLQDLDESDEVPIGSPLSSTSLKLRLSICKNNDNNKSQFEGEILIGYEDVRKCTIFSEKYGTVIEPMKLDFDDNNLISKNYTYFQTGDYGRQVISKCIETGEEIVNLYFVNRIDRIRKRNGIKVDLEEIEKVAYATFPNIFSVAICMDYEQKILLLLKLQDTHYDQDYIVSQLHSNLKSKLYFESHPDRIILITSGQDFPINSHGKLDLKKIVNMTSFKSSFKNYGTHSNLGSADVIDPVITKSCTMDDSQFEQIFNTLWNFNTSRNPTSMTPLNIEDCFLASGGNSISANRFVEEFFDKIGKFGSLLHIENEKSLIKQLLCESYACAKTTFHEIQKKCNYYCQFAFLNQNINAIDLKQVEKGCEKQNLIRIKSYDVDVSVTVNKETQTQYKASFKLPPECTVRRTLALPIGLCVDATPVISPHPIHGHICIVGSHSGAVQAFSMPDLAKFFETFASSTLTYCPEEPSEALDVGELPAPVWHKFLPDRIESTIAIHSSLNLGYFGYVGCHDGRLYKMSTINGNIEWSFCCDSEIRSAPAISPDGNLVVFSSPYRIYCLDANSGTIRWTKHWKDYILQTYSVILSAACVFVSTVNGILTLLLKDGKVFWRSSHKNICTTPLLVEKNNSIVFGDRSGSVFALDQVNGNPIWSTSEASDKVSSPLNYLVYHQCSVKTFHSSEDSVIIYSTHDGTIVCLDASDGHQLFYTVLGPGKKCRSKPLVIDVPSVSNSVPRPMSSASEGGSRPGPGYDELHHQRQKYGRCCCFVNSQDGTMFSIILEFESLECARITGQCKDTNTVGCVKRELFHFGHSGAESFSSPALDFSHNILAIGSRDNCVHFAMLV